MKRENTTNNHNKVTLDSIINDSLKNLKSIIDSNTVIGEEIITSDGTVVIPVSKIIVGFVAGGGEIENSDRKDKLLCQPFAGGSGAGFTVVPVGFLVRIGDSVSFVSAKSETKYDDLINLANKTLKLILDNMKQNK